jgi:hypothetical protein
LRIKKLFFSFNFKRTRVYGKNPEEYPAYDNIEDLKKALLSDDE